MSADASYSPARRSPRAEAERLRNLRRYAVDMFCDHLGECLDEQVLALDEDDQLDYLTWLAHLLADDLLRYIDSWESDYPSVEQWRRLHE